LLKCAERWGPEYGPKEVKEIPLIDFCEMLQTGRQALKSICREEDFQRKHK